jgi:acyl-coenzyme A synthetase/AMP-(fatty) acid ligase
VNFVTRFIDGAPPERPALVELWGEDQRRAWTFGEVSAHAAGLAGTLAERGLRQGDVVMTLIGNRSDWVLAMLACFRMGIIVLPCNEQLRGKDLRLRMDVAAPSLVLADRRNATQLNEARPDCDVLVVPDPRIYAGPPVPAVSLHPNDPCLITFTSGTAGEPKAVVHAQRYLTGQAVQAESWLAPRKGDLVWCTATSGWSKSARNSFIAPWLRGARALLHDGRFDPEERIAVLARERVNVLCMAPTEYRRIAKQVELRPLPALRGLVAAGEALNPEVIRIWREATGISIRDGYGQTETGQLTGVAADGEVRDGSMGRPLPGMSLWIEDGELVADPLTIPTFFAGYLGSPSPDLSAAWRTGDRVHADEEGYLFFDGRTDDVIISSGYRIGPFEVESALLCHEAVVEAAVVAAPDEERGSIVRAVVVLREGLAPSEDLVRDLQLHVKSHTAPYKYPRLIEFADALPKTASGKVLRARLRERPVQSPAS